MDVSRAAVPRVERKSVSIGARAPAPAAPSLEVEPQPVGRLFAERDDPLLAALAAHVDDLLLEVDVGERQVDRLLGAQPGRVDELEERAVAEPERAVLLQVGEERVGLRRLGGVRQAATAPPGDREIGHVARAAGRAHEGADGGELARDGGLGELARLPAWAVGAELGRVACEGARIEGLEPEPVAAEPARELLEVAAVGAPGRVGERLAAQEAVDRGACVHDEAVPPRA